MLKKLFAILIMLIPASLFAQNNTLTGNVFDNNTRSLALEGATVKNLSTKNIAVADKDGHFAISAKIGDLVTFGMVGYYADTVYLTNLFPKNVYLRMAVSDLKAVDITSAKISPYLETKDPNAKPARLMDYSKERGGLRLNLGYGKYKKQQAKIQQLEENDKYQEEISKNFNEETVKQLVKFQGPGIREFLVMYRPTVAEVKAEQPFNYSYHIARAYQSWLKLSPEQRKLPSFKSKGN